MLARDATRGRELYSNVQGAVGCRNQSRIPTACARWSVGRNVSPTSSHEEVSPTRAPSLPLTTTITTQASSRASTAWSTRIRFPVALFDHGNYETRGAKYSGKRSKAVIGKNEERPSRWEAREKVYTRLSLSLSLSTSLSSAAGRDFGAKRKKCRLHRTLVRLHRRRATAVDKISR